MNERTNAYDALVAANPVTPGDTPPSVVWSADVALLEIDRRIDTMQTQSKPIQVERHPGGPDRRRPLLVAAAAFVVVLVAVGIAALVMRDTDPGPAEPTEVRIVDTARDFTQAVVSGDFEAAAASTTPAADLTHATNVGAFMVAANADITDLECTETDPGLAVSCTFLTAFGTIPALDGVTGFQIAFDGGRVADAIPLFGTTAAQSQFFSELDLRHPDNGDADGTCYRLGNASERGMAGAAACAEIFESFAGASPLVLAARAFMHDYFTGNPDRMRATAQPRTLDSESFDFVIDSVVWHSVVNSHRTAQECTESVQGENFVKCRVTFTDDLSRAANTSNTSLFTLEIDETGWRLVDESAESNPVRDEILGGFMAAHPGIFDEGGICEPHLGNGSEGRDGPQACKALILEYITENT